jgi:hypothetical protein
MRRYLQPYEKSAAGLFQLDLLESLPCGCVAAGYRPFGLQLNVISLEAKGPHCMLVKHRAGQVLGFAEASEPEDEGEQG